MSQDSIHENSVLTSEHAGANKTKENNCLRFIIMNKLPPRG